MNQAILFAVILFYMCSCSYAISKNDYFSLPFENRRDFQVIDGAHSPEYAIPREEYVALSSETVWAIDLEIKRRQFLYARGNIGKKHKDLDMSQLFNPNLTARNYRRDPGVMYPERIIDYSMLAGYCENYFEGAKYMFKHYREFIKHEQGLPSLWALSGEDSHVLSDMVFFYEDHKLYREWDAMFADYDKAYWKGMPNECCPMRPHDKACVKEKLSSCQHYKKFLSEWRTIKKLAKTVKPAPLSPQVQSHEWFYSDRQEEVLKALEYYYKNQVGFMLEKALKHKDPVIAAKAKEYLEKLGKGEKNETENKKP